MTRAALLLVMTLPVLACGSTLKYGGGDADAGPDVHHDTGADVGSDVGPDVQPDTMEDPGEDPGDDTPGTECGNGVPEFGEDCDDGNDTDGDGCDNDCTWTCTRNWECADEDHCTSDVCEVSTHTCTHEAIDCADSDDCTVDGCDPASGCTHERLPNWYRDEDGDSYGTSSDVRCAESAPEGYVGNDDDCCDTDGDINPGVTSWFTVRHYCTSTYGSFDYNCDGVPERRWLSMGSCSHTGGVCSTTPGWDLTWMPSCGMTEDWIVTCATDTSSGACVPSEVVRRTMECH